MSFKRLAIILLFAAVLAIIIRIFFFETIRVTTPAMSESQSIGNRLIVEKFTIGPRLPLSIGVPFAPNLFLGKRTYFPISKNAHRIPGVGIIMRNDLLAFNLPIEDKEPIDVHPVLLSRCIGLPGEYISLQGSRIFINDKEIERPVNVSICYSYPTRYQERIENLLEAGHLKLKTYQENDSGFIYLTRYEYFNLSKREKNDAIELRPCSSSFDEQSTLIPYKDFRIELNERTFNMWGELINKYEGVKLIRTKSGYFRKNGKEAEFYIFKQNYYWMLNDHQGYLDDSRSFGLIPESYLIGKVYMLLFSPKTKKFFQKV